MPLAISEVKKFAVFMSVSSLLRGAAETQKKIYSILLAEDDLDDQELIIEIIHQIDKTCRIFRATNGKQVLECLERLSPSRYPDLLLLDYKMPIVNGEEVLLTLAKQEKYRQIPKVILTSTSPGAEKSRCFAAGAIGYLSKSDRASEMRETLGYILKYALGDYGRS